jgi:hypothetical protein
MTNGVGAAWRPGLGERGKPTSRGNREEERRRSFKKLLFSTALSIAVENKLIFGGFVNSSKK